MTKYSHMKNRMEKRNQFNWGAEALPKERTIAHVSCTSTDNVWNVRSVCCLSLMELIALFLIERDIMVEIRLCSYGM